MSEQIASYYDHIYDSLGKDYQQEAGIIDSLLRRSAYKVSNILDVGCGTGRHAEILASTYGYEVTGLDRDAGMIDKARSRAPNIDFHVGDMRHFSLDKRYDAIICLFNAINNASGAQETIITLRNFGTHLLDGGVLIVEPWITPENFSAGKTFTDRAEVGPLKICRITGSTVSGNISTLHSKWLIERQEKLETVEETINLTLFTQEEMLDFFKVSGFSAESDPMPGQFGKRGLYIARK